jgi:hypothetical protein
VQDMRFVGEKIRNIMWEYIQFIVEFISPFVVVVLCLRKDYWI